MALFANSFAVEFMLLNSSNCRYLILYKSFCAKTIRKAVKVFVKPSFSQQAETRNSNTLTGFSFKTEGFINQYNIVTYRHLLRESLESVLGVIRVHLAAV